MMNALLSSVSYAAMSAGSGSSWPAFASLLLEDSAINTTYTSAYTTTNLTFPDAGVYLLVIQGSFDSLGNLKIDLQSITDATFEEIKQWGNTQYDVTGFWKVTVNSGGVKTLTYRGNITHVRSQVAIYTPNEAIDWGNPYFDSGWNQTTVSLTFPMNGSFEKGSIVASYWNNIAGPTHTGPSTVDIPVTLITSGFYGSMRSQNDLPASPNLELTNSGGSTSRTMLSAIMFGYLSELLSQSIRVGRAKTYTVAGSAQNGITIAKHRNFTVVGSTHNSMTISLAKTYIVVEP